MNKLNKPVITLFAVAALFSIAFVSAAQESQFFRIGTGGSNGTYYPVGSLIAQAISDVPGDSSCGNNPCGAAGVIAIPQTANGSIANIEEIQAGTLEAGLAQSNIAHWAYSGTGVYLGKSNVGNLRAIARLYTESMHLVARKSANINSIDDLRGKRVSMDEPGSGTLVDASLLLKYYDVSIDDLDVQYVKPSVAKAMIMMGELDAFFIVAGFPVSAVTELALTGEINLVPIDGPTREKLIAREGFILRNTIPADVYRDIPTTETIGVGALMLVSAEIEEETIYNITKALWSERTKEILFNGHEKGREIVIERAADGVTVPFHPGAVRFYNEVGLKVDQ